MICRDKYGWPVELIIGRPVTNFIRLLIHTNIWQTWHWRDPKHDDGIVTDTVAGVGSCAAPSPAKTEGK